jgi:hypothetical protein
MDNAERIYQELIHEEGGLWFVYDEYGFKVIVKAPSNSIKAIIKGCRLLFIFGRDNVPTPALFHSCIRVYDDPINFLQLSGSHRFIEDHNAVKKVMEEDRVQVQLFNELNMCTAFGNLKFGKSSRERVLNMLGNPGHLYSGDFNEQTSWSLDCFDFSSGSGRTFDKNVRPIDVIEIEGKLENITIMQNYVAGFNQTELMRIDDESEGKVLEQQVWAVLDYLFEKDIHRSPQVKHKQGYRELTDVMAYSEHGIFLIETKALGVINVEKEASMERKVLNIQKAIKKGISQLVGAAKKVQEGAVVYDRRENELHFDRSICPHCIVLVSELLPFGEWKDVEFSMFKAMMEQRMFLNVMELKEFMQFVGYSKGNKHNLDYFLMQRAQNFVKEPGIHTKTVFKRGSDEANG